MVITDANGLPFSVHTSSASPHEVLLIEATIDQTYTEERPGRLIGDRAYDSDSLDQRLVLKGVELVAIIELNLRLRMDVNLDDISEDGKSNDSLPG